jgi:hypothetical protein
MNGAKRIVERGCDPIPFPAVLNRYIARAVMTYAPAASIMLPADSTIGMPDLSRCRSTRIAPTDFALRRTGPVQVATANREAWFIGVGMSSPWVIEASDGVLVL